MDKEQESAASVMDAFVSKMEAEAAEWPDSLNGEMLEFSANRGKEFASDLRTGAVIIFVTLIEG